MGQSVLPRSTDEAMMKENLDIFDWPMPEDLMAKFSEIKQARLKPKKHVSSHASWHWLLVHFCYFCHLTQYGHGNRQSFRDQDHYFLGNIAFDSSECLPFHSSHLISGLIWKMQERLLRAELAVHPLSLYKTLEDLWDGEIQSTSTSLEWTDWMSKWKALHIRSMPCVLLNEVN